MHRFDDDGTLYARIEAPAARLTPGRLAARERDRVAARRPTAASSASRRRRPAAACRPTLTSDEILDSFAPPETVGFWDLGRFIAQMEESGFSGQRHRLFLQSELAKPALFAAMVLIGAAFALRPTRFGQTGVMILLAVLAGLRALLPQGLRRVARRPRRRSRCWSRPGRRRSRRSCWRSACSCTSRTAEVRRRAGATSRCARRLAGGARRAGLPWRRGAPPPRPQPPAGEPDRRPGDLRPRDRRCSIASGNVEVLYQGRVLRAAAHHLRRGGRRDPRRGAARADRPGGRRAARRRRGADPRPRPRG